MACSTGGGDEKVEADMAEERDLDEEEEEEEEEEGRVDGGSCTCVGESGVEGAR